ncbi:DUF1616 domain-containing protein [Halobaculum magnesiiphilum]|uniref:DUF1616 domain-containing protein n=1 Tax=Halobaculum magnesiiphilum TaxID=1017351 RepID=A0A8T8WF25_9EURY|nr:DUF1616 domain-containing protein [Halobaculum magnesiiphilum]QZP38445.1 DUF1616 domain-containing protein [Halobaculum magnesiiphilum]
MRADPRWRQILPAPVRRLPADLAAVVVAVALTVVAVFTPGIDETPLRVIVGLPFVLFVPGYALIAALFPEVGSGPTNDRDPDGPVVGDADAEAETPDAATETADESGIDGIERVALSFGTSIAVVPLVGLVLNFTPFGIRLVPIVASVGGVTLVLTAVAARRRRALPEDERFRVPYRRWASDAHAELFEPDTRTDAALNVLLAISVIVAVSSVGYAVAVPKQGESFSEFYLLTEGEDGELVADDYPTEFTQGEPQSLVVGVSNHEHRSVNYTVVAAIQRVEVSNNSTTVEASSQLREWRVELADNETWQLEHTVAPEMTGDRLRLTYFLYRGDPPETLRADTAYRELHLWVNVTAPT